MRNLFIVDIEPLDTRYTKTWQTHIPQLLNQEMGVDYNVVQISGAASGYDKPAAGAFFDFAATCEYKASQCVLISQMFQNGEIKPNDIFFFTDAWNQTIHSVKYMSELTNVPVKIAGIWHAGAYDPTDILGTNVKSKRWIRKLEQSYYDALDISFFGTQQHLTKFVKNLSIEDSGKCVVAGYPLEWIAKLRNTTPKSDIVVFPHRLNDDKAPWIFDALEKQVHQTHSHIKFIKTQKLNLSKDQYYEMLAISKVVFSANRHENLGIGTFEAMSSGCIPILPDKLSYAEMYQPKYKYQILPQYDLYDDFEYYLPKLADLIISNVENYQELAPLMCDDIDYIQTQFFSGVEMISVLKAL